MMEEYDVSLVLLENIYSLYGLKEDSSKNKLYHYLYIKTCIANDKKKAEKFDILKLILSELNVDTFSFDVIFHDTAYDLITIAIELLDNLEFMASLEGKVDLSALMQDIYKKGYRKSDKYRKLSNHKTYIKYNRLLVLNEEFGITPSASMGIEGFKTNNGHNPFRRSLEETLEANLAAEKFKGSHTTTHITEKQLEDYLSDNLELIEEGMTFFGRQIEVPGGIIDILAKDRDNNICIIELKIKEDKSIVWQSMHYPKEIRKKYRGYNKLRMITVAPTYSEHLLKALRDLDDVELFDYSINVSMGKIENLSLRKTI